MNFQGLGADGRTDLGVIKIQVVGHAVFVRLQKGACMCTCGTCMRNIHDLYSGVERR